MKHRTECTQTWQAEAIDDGRLGGADRALFERHALSCSACASEWRQLTELREVMSHLPEASSSPFVSRRLRAQLIERAARDGWSNQPSFSGRLVMALAGAALLVAALAFGFSRWRSLAPAHSARFTVEDVHLARWSEEQVGEVTRLRLSSGSAAFQVHRVEQHQQFLLLLPDGEIEVHGTRFLVELAEGRTARVSVTEGIVALRLQSETERLLHAGESWSRPILPGPTSAAPSGADEPVAATPLAAPPPAPVSADRPPAPASRPSVNGAQTEEARPSLDSFAAGVSAFEAGDYRRADGSLSRFLDEAPSDPRSEDASFLRALAHARWGDKQGAARLAQRYLSRFPAGLRLKEAERLLNGATSPAPGSAGTRDTETKTPPK